MFAGLCFALVLLNVSGVWHSYHKGSSRLLQLPFCVIHLLLRVPLAVLSLPGAPEVSSLLEAPMRISIVSKIKRQQEQTR